VAPRDQAAPHNQRDTRAAFGRPVGAGHPTYAEIAEHLLDRGYEPIPIKPNQKAPAASRWSTVPIDAAQVADWAHRYPDHGVGLRTGTLVALDIDIVDPDQAHDIMELAHRRLGETLLRVGRWPKRLLLYRNETPIPKIDVKPIEILGRGQQFVAFGIHENTGRPYEWRFGETPLDVALEDLPLAGEETLQAFVAEARAIVPDMGRGARAVRQGGTGRGIEGPVRDKAGRVIDGRDAWLSQIAYHVVHDALDNDDWIDLDRLAQMAWDRFEETTDLYRARQDGASAWSAADARSKVREKLRLHGQRRLPPRQRSDIEASYDAPSASREEARRRLEEILQSFCDRVIASVEPPGFNPAPRLGIRATVGLGKSTTSRRHLLDLRRRLGEMDAPNRIVILTPSHELAEETAAAWRALGERVAILRGYERMHPVHQARMCQDVEAVRAAIGAGMDPQGTVCVSKTGAVCPHFGGCLKQENRAEVAGADIVVAPYDALYTGLAIDPDTVGLIFIDEGCWQRAVRETTGLTLESLTTDPSDDLGIGMVPNRDAEQLGDRMEARRTLQAALASSGPGPVTKSALLKAGLTGRSCADAANLEQRQLRDPGLAPGLTVAARKCAFDAARRNARILKMIVLWRTARDILEAPGETTGRLRVCDPGEDGLHSLAIVGLSDLHLNFRHKPVLHLDATLRPELATALLPDLQIETIEAAEPHKDVTLVTGNFGKSGIIPDNRTSADENRRRHRNLADCVDFVRWHTRRLSPGRVLVVTNKACESAFVGIPGVETAHFNAIAGLDAHKNVAGLFIVGRPLPRDSDLLDPCAALLRHAVDGSYTHKLVGVRMRDGSSRAVRALRHTDPPAELMRASICDDELIQAIGRGRGVNRTADNPLEVYVMADVALPLVHDRVVAWDTVKPDVVQRMLLAGLAVDSPSDAAVLHPELLNNAEAAKKQFERAGFKGQIPISTYRGMSLKSAAYRRPGRGRSWQRAYWLEGDEVDVRARLESALGKLDAWDPDV